MEYQQDYYDWDYVAKYNSEEIFTDCDEIEEIYLLLKITIKHDLFLLAIQRQTHRILIILIIIDIEHQKEEILEQIINLSEKVQINQDLKFQQLFEQIFLIYKIYFLIFGFRRF